MGSWLQKLSHPYRLEFAPYKQVQRAVIFGGFVFAFLFVFKPFGLAAVHNLLLVSLGYGLVTLSSMVLLNVGFRKVFSKLFLEEYWTVGKEIIWYCCNVLLIGFSNAAYSAWLGYYPWSIEVMLLFELYTLAIGIFPISISILLSESQLDKKYKRQAEEINQSILHHEVDNTDAQVYFVAENGKDQLNIALSNLLYVQSADNYIEIYYLEHQQTKKVLLRQSLKKVSDELKDRAQLFRCHKSYLVNLVHVHHLSGNAQGYKLHINHSDNAIPVSRQLNDSIKELINRY